MYEKVLDSSRPGLIPAGSLAGVYYDGKYAASPGQIRRFKAVRLITVIGGPKPALFAGVADFEPGNAIFHDGGRYLGWAEERIALHHLAITYVNGANAREAFSLVNSRPQVRKSSLWWFATLDNTPRTPEQVCELMHKHGAPVDVDEIWGHQYAGGETAPYDTTNLFLPFYGR
jgi:hypothetical protein